jgi:galactofuranose transport system permease protein
VTVAVQAQAIAPARSGGIVGQLKHNQTARAVLALILLLIYNIFFTRNFLTMGTLNANLTQVATIVIVGVGMTFVIATGGIDLSVGSLMAVAGVMAPLFLVSGTQFGAPWVGLLLAILVPLLFCGLLGAFNGMLVARLGLQPIIATLVLFLAGRGLAQVIVNGELREFRALQSPLTPALEFIGRGSVLGIRFQILLMVAIVIAAAWALRATTFGRYVLATGGNEAAARLAGVPVGRVKVAVYTLSGVLAAVAGLIVVAINRSADPHKVGEYMELDAIAAVAVGGTPLTGGRATVVGTLLGAIIIQLLRNTLISQNVPDGIARIVIAGVIVVAVFLQRQRSN